MSERFTGQRALELILADSETGSGEEEKDVSKYVDSVPYDGCDLCL